MNAFSQISKQNKFKHTLSAESKLAEFLESVNDYFELTNNLYKNFAIWNNKVIDQTTKELAVVKIVELEEENNSDSE